MICAWCRSAIADTNRGQRKYCDQACRQAAWRMRGRVSLACSSDGPLRFAYADPPYPGFARKCYQSEEVDHAALVASLVDRRYAGWALSTSSKTLREVLPLCPPAPESRVCAWVKPIGASSRTFGIHGCWEPVIVVGGRRRQPGRRDWLSAMPARGGGDLIGRKPIAFCAWLFDLLGMQPGDTLDDLFPGTGIVGRSWASLSSGAALDDTSPRGVGDASPVDVVTEV